MDLNIPPPPAVDQSKDDGKLHVTSRETYDAPEDLRVSSVNPDPLEQFRQWFTSVQGGLVREPEAVALSTADAKGIPSVRFVLLKELDKRGFVFFTNYTSRKSKEIEENGHAAMAFYWREVHKSVRVVGRVEKVTPEETAAYYRTRPVGSRLGAWASKQSSVVEDGQVQDRLEKIKQRFNVTGEEADADVPVPDFWGGWRIVPEWVIPDVWCIHR
jgi:pyridoxamine-phosphate oxidase